MFSFFVVRSLTAVTLLSLVSEVLGTYIIPCSIGAGPNGGCSGCNMNKTVQLPPWSSAKVITNFDMPTAASQTGGGGYDVWWNVSQPDPGCRALIMQPFDTDKGSIFSELSGDVILSVAHGGCYYAHINSRGLAAGFCCGSGDCKLAAATTKKKREISPDKTIPTPVEKAYGATQNPYATQSATPSGIQCSAPVAVGDTYTKAGQQQIEGQTLNCDGGSTCSMTPDMSVSAGTSITNEQSTSYVDSHGQSISVAAGFFIMGPTGTVTVDESEDWSNSVSQAMTSGSSTSITKSLALNIQLVPGGEFNLWFTPKLTCQTFNITCGGADTTVEKCSPSLDESGNPSGAHGVMTVG